MIIPQFHGTPDQIVSEWLGVVERKCKERSIPLSSWVDIGFAGLAPNVEAVLEGIQTQLENLSGKKWTWSWRTFKNALTGIDKEVREKACPDSFLEKVKTFQRTHPKICCAAGVGLIGLGATVLAPAALVGGLNLIGFSSIGPVAGSIAAGLQSTVYGGAVASGSAFALAQSAAMGGVAVASGQVLVAGAGAATAGGWFGFSKLDNPPAGGWKPDVRASFKLLALLMKVQ